MAATTTEGTGNIEVFVGGAWKSVNTSAIV